MAWGLLGLYSPGLAQRLDSEPTARHTPIGPPSRTRNSRPGARVTGGVVSQGCDPGPGESSSAQQRSSLPGPAGHEATLKGVGCT